MQEDEERGNKEEEKINKGNLKIEELSLKVCLGERNQINHEVG